MEQLKAQETGWWLVVFNFDESEMNDGMIRVVKDGFEFRRIALSLWT